jgi:hypothetical protein
MSSSVGRYAAILTPTNQTSKTTYDSTEFIITLKKDFQHFQ